MALLQNSTLTPCPQKPELQERPLLIPEQAIEIADIFKILANDTRLRLLHALVLTEELCVTELSTCVGMKTQAVSNQLQRLINQGILRSRRDGNNIYYQIADPCVIGLLEQGLCLMEEAKERSRERTNENE